MSPSYFYDKTLRQTIRKLEGEASKITPERVEQLKALAELMRESAKKHGTANVIFICTHNSRRSQLADVWFRTVANMYIPSPRSEFFDSYSGGTEATAFNYRMVAALERIGFLVEKLDITSNPKFKLSPIHLLSSKKWRERFGHPIFSKKYDYFSNPQSGFIAVLVCDEAAESCPYVAGAEHRFAMPYSDPKVFDGSEEEQQVYDEKVSEIGREMIYLARLLKK